MFAILALASLTIFLVGALAGVPLLAQSYRRGLAVLSIATSGGFVFSFLAGFSIGRLTALLPLVLTAYAVTYRRLGMVQLAGHLAAIAIYVLLSWVLAGEIYYWGIQIELPLCLIAYLVAGALPRSTPHQG
ncbi:MAG: hypothetical protein M3077_12945 [Candidatus Dormibacteraeota bacterium]|nr:hypothetical protein [Candidatus Dormibacteraeota bacterium]